MEEYRGREDSILHSIHVDLPLRVGCAYSRDIPAWCLDSAEHSTGNLIFYLCYHRIVQLKG
jgi:hypothetical protein